MFGLATSGYSPLMSESTTDQITGRIKEAAGALSGDDELKSDGQDDQKAAEAKSQVDKVADTVKNAVDDVKERISRS